MYTKIKTFINYVKCNKRRIQEYKKVYKNKDEARGG